MKIIRKEETKIFKNSDSCIAIEYPSDDKDINAAIIEINGRYPENKNAQNEVCKEMAYIINGQGKLTVNGQEFAIKPGDLITINPGEKFFWQGNLKMFMPCTPAWHPQQYKTTA